MLSDPEPDLSPLWLLRDAGPAAAPALPRLRQIVEGDDSSLGVAALYALWSITGDPVETVEHCRRMLPQVGPRALVGVFSELGSHAGPFADDVRAAFDEDYWPLPIAHWRITGDVDASLPDLIASWRSRRGAHSGIVGCWAEMGAAASERTVPLLRAELAIAERATYSGSSTAVEDDEEFLTEVRAALAALTADPGVADPGAVDYAASVSSS